MMIVKLSFYTALIYGCTTDADYQAQGAGDGPVFAEIGRELGVAIITAYEAEPAYIGVVLAVSSPRLAQEWGVPQLPLYFAAPLDELAAQIRAQVSKQALPRAKQAWARVRQHVGSNHDIELAAGGLLYIHEYG